MANQVIQILSSAKKEGVGKTSKAPYSMVICQAILHTEGEEVRVGELTMPKDATAPIPGKYTAQVVLGVDYQTKKVVAQIAALVPFREAASGAPAPGR